MKISKEEYLINCLGEEGVEIAQRVFKINRFGLNEIQPGQELNNLQRLQIEITDFVATLQMLAELMPEFDGDIDLDAAVKRKQEKLKKYIKYSQDLGIVEKQAP